MNIEFLIIRGYLTKVPPAKDLAEKEMKESRDDLGEAKKELGSKGYKWATVKAYYAMFHSAKAVLFLMGLKERSHYVVGEVLDILSKEGKLESNYVNDFKAAMSAREGADYHYSYDEKTADDLVAIAEEFTKRMKKLAATIKI
jgi:uncharacterized protein (UPF0332 family)